MASYTIEATVEQDQALAWVAEQAEQEPAAYLQARNTDILNDYLIQYNLATAPVPTEDVAKAYAMANPQQQAEAVAALGMETTKPG